MKRFVFGIFVIAFATVCFSGEIYTAKEENLPDWARQGKFHFLRLDGGRIEAVKAGLTDWGAGFSNEEKEILSHVYDRHAEDMIHLLKEAHFNWIWVTWSNGFSLKEESENRALCKHFMGLCHKEGIKVTAYLSLSNMFWHNMFIDEPQSITWVQLKNGKPVNYGGPHNVERYLADINNQEWREYVKKRVQLALDAGFDALFFDNLQAEKEGIKSIFSEIQRMAEMHAMHTSQPKPLLFCNVHLNPERLEVNEICEAVWNEYGRSTPGVWDGVWWVDNTRKTKYIKGDLLDWKPQFYDIPITHRGTRETDIYRPKEEKLSIAEAVAFGSELGRNIEGRFLKGLIKKENNALEAWKWISQYNGFTRENEALYVGAKPVSHVLVLTQYNPLRMNKSSQFDAKLQDMLTRASVQYDVCTIQRLPKLEIKKKYALIVISPSIELTRDRLEKLASLLATKGKMIGCSQEELGKDNLLRFSDKERDEIKRDGISRSFLKKIHTISPQDQVTIDQPYVLASLMEMPNEKIRVLHLLNYADTTIAKVCVELHGLTQQPQRDVALLSPDGLRTKLEILKKDKNILHLLIQDFDTYAVIVIP